MHEKNFKTIIRSLALLLASSFFILVLIPYSMQAIINIDSAAKGSDDGWLGFWGGYLGSVIGVLGTYAVLRVQLKNEKTVRMEEKVDNTFFNLLSLHNNQLEKLKEEIDFTKIYKKFAGSISRELSIGAYKYVTNNTELILELENWKQKLELYISNNERNIPQSFQFLYNLYWKQQHSLIEIGNSNSAVMININKAINSILTIESILNNEVKGTKDTNQSLQKKLKIIENSFENIKEQKLYPLINEINLYYQQKYDVLSDEQRQKCIENVLSGYYNKLGAQFRLFHRIIKYLNNNVENEKAKKNYLGFLRSTVNQDELLVIFYNAAYTKRGEGLLKELQKTTFFGTEEDLKNNQHFDTNELFWKEDDIKIMLNKNNEGND
ncbi:putative phage abortive infection protein [Enterococcus mundtii]|uniref:putative phage abortive infection protein n=1 Tax=Enterococcus mundtii TaxID=53346 RepID=UPI0032DE949C